MYIVLGGYLRILGAPSVQSCCTLSISTSHRVFVYDRYRKSCLYIFTDGYKDAEKTAAAIVCPCFEFLKRLPNKSSIFMAELEAIVSALCY